jgi:hypothetical protein
VRTEEPRALKESFPVTNHLKRIGLYFVDRGIATYSDERTNTILENHCYVARHHDITTKCIKMLRLKVWMNDPFRTHLIEDTML